MEIRQNYPVDSLRVTDEEVLFTLGQGKNPSSYPFDPWVDVEVDRDTGIVYATPSQWWDRYYDSSKTPGQQSFNDYSGV